MKTYIFRSLGLLVFISFLIQPLQAQKKDNSLKGFDKFIESTMKDWNVPGLSVAIVKDGDVLLAKGYGYADVENKRKADSKTLFAIGSSSKAFTAAAVMQLVDEKKIDLDEPIITYLPDFKLYDNYATNHITARDLLSHRSGLPRHDFAWYGSDASRTELYNRLRYLEPTAELRETWQYQNLMYMTAGYLVGQIEGESWEESLQRKILNPLEMTSTNFSVEDMKKVKNHALPYEEKEEKAVKMDFRNIDAVGPAGSINSNAEDMAKWLQLLLNEGNFDGTEVLSSSSMKELYQPQMVMPGGISYDEVFYNSYGLGWILTSYRGKLRVEHGGNIDGFTTSVCFMPRDGFGVVVMANMNGTTLNHIIRNYVIDNLLEVESKDWNSILLERRKEALKAAKAVTEEDDIVQIKNTKPSFALKDYVGKYEHKGYGVIEIIEKKGDLNILRGGDETALTHYHFDVFQTGDDAGKLKVQFQMNVNGEITSIDIPLEASLKPIKFKRLDNTVEVAVNDLKIYEGKYLFAQVGQSATVKVDGENLAVTIPGQPTYTLVPHKEHHFKLQDLEGYSMKFTVEDGVSTKATFIQPNGNFTFAREE
ncbi:MAG: serine hydrolase [Saprospiraceae bacterium]